MGIRSAIRRLFSSDKPIQSSQTALLLDRYAKLKATYDASRNGDEYKNIWANADQYDADSANSKAIRHSLISRSRYEINNNGFSDGIAQTVATDLIGCGPTLRMQTGSDGFNRMIEDKWYTWCKAVQFRRKLWCMAHAKHSDGEAFGIVRRNPNVNHPIKLDLVLIEAEQCQTPFLPFAEPGHIDGIKFDEFGNPLYYEILKQHPGAINQFQINLVPEQIPADQVLHWFMMRRPGQHRGVAEMASTLNTGAAARRWREATLAAAETAADFTLFLKTQMTPDEAVFADPMSTLDIQKRMMTALPAGYEVSQMDTKHPSSTFAEFHRSLINEQARPKSMPFNKAACDSSSYNYASGRLDHQTYYAALDVEREDCNDQVLDHFFPTWFDAGVRVYGWLGGNPLAIQSGARTHLWDWPKHRVADVEAEANANETKLQSGQMSLPQLMSESGLDFADVVTDWAQSFGVGEDEIKKRLLDITLPEAKVPATPKQNAPSNNQPANNNTAYAALSRINGNGANHG